MSDNPNSPLYNPELQPGSIQPAPPMPTTGISTALPTPAHENLDDAIASQSQVTNELRKLCQRIAEGEQANALEKQPTPPRVRSSLRGVLDTGAKELHCCRDEQLALIVELNALLFSSN